MTITPQQCRAARALLGWSQDHLATKANVARATIADFERGTRMPMKNNMAAIEATFDRADVVFVPGNGDEPGVRLRGARSEECVRDLIAIGESRHTREQRRKEAKQRVDRYLEELAQWAAEWDTDNVWSSGYRGRLKERLRARSSKGDLPPRVSEILEYAIDMLKSA